MLFSVLLSVYSKEKSKYLSESLYSIYDAQTLKPSQIVLVKDGPLTTDLDAVIDDWQRRLGDKLLVLSLDENKGLANALNYGLAYCKYELVARMDTDDVSLPNRFEMQVEFMSVNPQLSASSGNIIEYDEDLNNALGCRKLPSSHDELTNFCKYRSPLSHPAVMFRKSVITSVGGYPLFSNSQDWALWSLLIVQGSFIANIDDTLLHMRTDSSLFERRGFKYYLNEMKVFKYQRDIGLTKRKEYFANVFSKGVLRLSPKFAKRFAYKRFRK